MWMIVDLLGHTRHAGLVTEETWGGSPMLRIEQPGWVEGGAQGDCEGGVARSRAVAVVYPPRTIRVPVASVYRATEATEAEVQAALPGTTWDDAWLVGRHVGEWEAEEVEASGSRYASVDEEVA